MGNKKKTYIKPKIEDILMPDAWAQTKPAGASNPTIGGSCFTGSADAGGNYCAPGGGA